VYRETLPASPLAEDPLYAKGEPPKAEPATKVA